MWSALVVVARASVTARRRGGRLSGRSGRGPFAFERLLVALDLAVGLGSAGRDAAVADPVVVRAARERAVVAVDEGVVGQQPLRLDPVAA